MKYPFTKQNQVSIFGKLNTLDWTAFNLELDKWEQGQRGYLTVQKEQLPKTIPQLAYYYAVILPTGFEAMAENDKVCLEFSVGDKTAKIPLTLDSVDLFFKARYAEYRGVYLDKAEMSKEQCADFEDFVIQWLATWLNCHVPPADLNWRDRPQPTKKE